jgi:hypothetical protein
MSHGVRNGFGDVAGVLPAGGGVRRAYGCPDRDGRPVGRGLVVCEIVATFRV